MNRKAGPQHTNKYVAICKCIFNRVPLKFLKINQRVLIVIIKAILLWIGLLLFFDKAIYDTNEYNLTFIHTHGMKIYVADNLYKLERLLEKSVYNRYSISHSSLRFNLDFDDVFDYSYQS